MSDSTEEIVLNTQEGVDAFRARAKKEELILRYGPTFIPSNVQSSSPPDITSSIRFFVGQEFHSRGYETSDGKKIRVRYLPKWEWEPDKVIR